MYIHYICCINLNVTFTPTVRKYLPSKLEADGKSLAKNNKTQMT